MFVEKPLHTSLQRAGELLGLFAQSELPVGVGYMNRYRESVRRVRALLPTLEVIGFQGRWVCKPYAVPWWSDRALSGGALNEQATHLVDLVRFLMGEVGSVAAYRRQARSGSSESVCVALDLQAGITGSLLYSCSGCEKDIGLQIFTDRGTIGWPAGTSPRTPQHSRNSPPTRSQRTCSWWRPPASWKAYAAAPRSCSPLLWRTPT